MGQRKGLQKSGHPIVPPTATSHPRTSCLAHLTSCLKSIWKFKIEFCLHTQRWLQDLAIKTQSPPTPAPHTSLVQAYHMATNNLETQLSLKQRVFLWPTTEQRKSYAKARPINHLHGTSMGLPSAHPRTSCMYRLSLPFGSSLSGDSMCISQINLMLKAKPLFYFVTYDPNSLNQGHHPPPSGSLSLQMQFMKVFWPNSDNPRIWECHINAIVIP